MTENYSILDMNLAILKKIFIFYLNFATIMQVIYFNNFIFKIDPSYLWGILALFLIGFTIFSLILRFHWNNYSPDNSSKVLVKSLFWSVSFALIILAAVSLLTLELSI